MKKITLYWLVSLLLSSYAYAVNYDYQKQFDYSLKQTLSHISREDTPRGFVVAARSRENPPYYFHWVRDAALVMRALNESLDWEQKLPLFKDYVELTRNMQGVPTLSGLGEPKFNPDGSGYADDWARPQNDGPALRAISLIEFAHQLLDRGQVEYVRTHLYSQDFPPTSVIKKDMEYTAQAWRNMDFDLWEEVKGTHFYTRMAQRTALIMAADLAKRLDDPGAAEFYLQNANEITTALRYHWDVNENKILSTIDRSQTEGLNYKQSNLDSSVILAANQSSLPGLEWGPLDPRVQATAFKIIESFQRIYEVNHQYNGVAIGRYPEDQYYGGNPWFLLTQGFGELFYRIALGVRYQDHLDITEVNRPLFEKVLERRLEVGRIQNGTPEFQTALEKISAYGESFADRAMFHAGPDGQMDEQIDRHNGYMRSAEHLTWSYASYLTMFNQRQRWLNP